MTVFEDVPSELPTLAIRSLGPSLPTPSTSPSIMSCLLANGSHATRTVRHPPPPVPAARLLGLPSVICVGHSEKSQRPPNQPATRPETT
eukprot:6508431-Pyramimonas_sp.AAC.1